jgi:ABC-type multidrug transport system ATPase subunit
MSAKKEITLTWTGLSASIDNKVLLDKCDGYCKPGEMLAIMGPSGAGKTTLLSLISQKGDPKLTVSGIVPNFQFRLRPTTNNSTPLSLVILEHLFTKTTFFTKCLL